MTEQPTGARPIDLLHDPAVHADPFATYADLRAAGPVFSSELGGYWIVSSYDDIARVLLDPAHFASARTNLEPHEASVARADGVIPLINSDGQEHAGYRELVRPLFSPQLSRAQEAKARTVVTGLIDSAAARGRFEVLSELAIPYVGRVVLPALGVPDADVDWLIERIWVQTTVPGRTAADPDREELANAEDGRRTEVVTYVEGLLETRRHSSGEMTDYFDVAARGEVGGAPLPQRAAVNLSLLMLNAGLHTTSYTIANMLVFLAEHPSHRDHLVANPGSIGRAVEELMRYESVVTTGRIALDDVAIGPVMVGRGDFVALPLGSAGRDERKFGHPDQVDFDRRSFSHLQFGIGIHRCVGMHLARMELRVAMEEIHRRIPAYRIAPATEPVRHGGQLRGTVELWLEV